MYLRYTFIYRYRLPVAFQSPLPVYINDKTSSRPLSFLQTPCQRSLWYIYQFPHPRLAHSNRMFSSSNQGWRITPGPGGSLMPNLQTAGFRPLDGGCYYLPGLHGVLCFASSYDFRGSRHDIQPPKCVSRRGGDRTEGSTWFSRAEMS
jgi:hypothetical protein